jgi:hypothetical protein
MKLSRLPLSRRRLLLCAPALWLAACASAPTLVGSWRDPALKAPVAGKLLVVGITRSDTNRRIFEDGFAQALRAAGRDAVASHTVAGEPGQLTDARLKQAIAASGASAMLTARVAHVDQKIDVVPGMPPPYYGRGFHGWYGGAWAMSQPDIVQYSEATIESTLWDVKTDRVIWSGTTRTTETDPAQLTAGLSKVLIDKMRADGVL